MPSKPKKPVATIDLHGYKRDQCIASVTAFVETTQKQFPPPASAWVCIITGSGHHSPAGPVLRDAVQALLEKREMEYTLPRGKGSFLVNVHSGHALVSPPALATCSKVQVVKSSSCTDTNNHVKLVNRPIIPSRLGDRGSTTTTISAREVAPKPSEVAADDVLVARVKQTSHQEHAHQKRHEEIQLKQALTASKRELEQEHREEQACLQAILEQSQRDEELRRANEQERLEEILQHSRNEQERIQQLEQEKLQEILQLSQQEQQHQQNDEQLNQVLQQSLQDVHAIDEELNRALSLSLQECHKNEHDVCLDDDKMSAAATSLELSIAESTTIEMLEKQVGYVIEEVD